VELQLSTHDGEHTVHGADVRSDVDKEHRHEHVYVLLVTLVELDALDQVPRQELAELLLSTLDGEDTEHGAHALSDVDPELKQEADHVSGVTNAEQDVQDLPLKHDHVDLQSSTHDWELSEHGAHALHDVDQELKLEAVCVLLVTLAVPHVMEL